MKKLLFIIFLLPTILLSQEKETYGWVKQAGETAAPVTCETLTALSDCINGLIDHPQFVDTNTTYVFDAECDDSGIHFEFSSVNPNVSFVWDKIVDLSCHIKLVMEPAIEDLQDQIDNLNVDDADADPTNEIQQLSIAANVISLSLGGGSVTIPAGVSPATQIPIADNEVDAAIRTGQVGTSLLYARADHNHPIRRQGNPGDMTITLTGPATLGSNQVIRRWSTEESYAYGYRANFTTTTDNGWVFITIPNKAGFQRPMIDGLGSYRYSGNYDNQPASPAQGNVGAYPNAPIMDQEINHYLYTQRIYVGRTNDKETLSRWWINWNTTYIRNLLIMSLIDFKDITINSVDDKNIDLVTEFGQDYFFGDFGYDITPLLSDLEWKEDPQDFRTYDAYIDWKIDQVDKYNAAANEVTDIINEKVTGVRSDDNDKIATDLRERIRQEFTRPNANSTIKGNYKKAELVAFADYYRIDSSGNKPALIQRIFDNVEKLK